MYSMYIYVSTDFTKLQVTIELITDHSPMNIGDAKILSLIFFVHLLYVHTAFQRVESFLEKNLDPFY